MFFVAAAAAMLTVTPSCRPVVSGPSSPSNNLEIARAFFDVLNSRNIDMVGPLIAQGATYIDLADDSRGFIADQLNSIDPQDLEESSNVRIVDYMTTNSGDVVLKLRDEDDIDQVMMLSLTGNCIIQVVAGA